MAESNRPTITNGDLDPATLSLVADFERSSPPILGINEEFIRTMCSFAGSQPVGAVDPYLSAFITESFDGRILFDTRQQSSQGEAPSSYRAGTWSTFMNSHAIWEPNQRAQNFVRTYNINLEEDSEILLRYQVDDQMWVTIDGKQVIADGPRFRPESQIGAIKITLQKGNHTIGIRGLNWRGPGGLALVIHLIRELKKKVIPQIVSPSTSRYVVKDGIVYIRKRAQDCGPDEDRTEDIEIGSYDILAGDSRNNLVTDSYLYYGRPILPGSRCSGSVDDTDINWWDIDPREESFPTNTYIDSSGRTLPRDLDPYGPDGDSMDDPPPITDRGCG